MPRIKNFNEISFFPVPAITRVIDLWAARFISYLYIIASSTTFSGAVQASCVA